MHPRLLELIQSHRSTLVFVNARRLAERLATRLNELALEGETHGDGVTGFGSNRPRRRADVELVKAHHGSLSRERRLQIEDELKSGRLKGLVCTSSLELGIDMGAVDLVVQVESPRSVAAGLQRIGRAGHQVGAPSRGKLFPKHRADLVEAAVVVDRMHQGLVERTRYPRNPLDVLAQQIVAMVALRAGVDEEAGRSTSSPPSCGGRPTSPSSPTRRSRPPSTCSPAATRPRSSASCGPASCGTASPASCGAEPAPSASPSPTPAPSPTAGLFGVFLPDGTRVGELDEEMVYESRPGETFLLGASTWRIEDITYDRVIVTPAPGQPGKMPFWHGDGPGRPLELGRAVGEFVREIRQVPGRRGRQPAARAPRPRRAGRPQPPAVPRRAGRGHRRRARRPHDRRRALPRRDRRLAGVRALAVRRPGARAVGDGAAGTARRAVGRRRRADLERRRHRPAAARGHRRAAPRGAGHRPRRDRRARGVGAAADGDVRLPLPGVRGPGPAAAPPPSRPAHAVVAAAPEGRRPARRRRQVPDVPDPARGHARVRQRRVRPAGAARGAAATSAAARCASSPSTRPGPRRWRSRCCSAGSPSTCTRATRRWPSGGPPPSPSTATCCATCSAPRSCASCSTRRCSPTSSSSSSCSSTGGGPATSTRCTTWCAASVRSRWPSSTPAPSPASTSPPPSTRWCASGGPSGWCCPAPTTERIAAAEDAARLRDALGVALPDRPAHRVHRPGRRSRSTTSSPASPAPTGPFLTEQVAWPRSGVPADRVTPVLERLEAEPAGWCGASSGPRASPASGATTTCSASCGGGRSPALRQGGRAGRDGRARPLPAGVARHRSAAARPRRRWSRCSASCRARRSPASVARGRHPPGPPATSTGRPTSTRCAPPARSCGSAPGASAPPTAGCGSPSATRRRRCWPGGAVDGFEPGPAHQAMLDHLGQRGASFWPELVRAVAAADQPYGDAEVLAALWDLVWAGLVTNDSLAPLRSLGVAAGRRRAAARRSAPVGRRRAPRPPRPAGRRRPLVARGAAARTGAVAHRGRPRPGGAAARAPRRPHPRGGAGRGRRGRLRRRLPGAQGAGGAGPGAAGLLRRRPRRRPVRPARRRRPAAHVPRRVDDAADGEGGVLVLSAVDPAQPYGAALRWPDTAGRPSRTAGAHLLLADGEPVAFLERGGHALATFPAAAAAPTGPPGWCRSSSAAATAASRSAPSTANRCASAPRPPPCCANGWVDAYKGLVRRQRPLSSGHRPRAARLIVVPEGDTIHRVAEPAAAGAGRPAARAVRGAPGPWARCGARRRARRSPRSRPSASTC